MVTLGAGNSTPHPSYGPASTLLSFHDRHYVIDLGAGALQKLTHQGVELAALDAVFLTHAHIDHLSDLLPLVFGISVETIERHRPLQFFLSAETYGYVSEVMRVFERWMCKKPQLFEWTIVAPSDRFVLDDMVVDVGSVAHTEGSVAWKWTTPDGRRVAIPGDTGAHEPLIDFVRGVDALVIECGNDFQTPYDSHLNPEQLRELLSAAQPKRSLVVHRPPSLFDFPLEEYLKETYHGEVHLPVDGTLFEI